MGYEYRPRLRPEILSHEPGEDMELRAGDVILTSGDGLVSQLIQLAQTLRYGDDPACEYNHLAIVGSDGSLREHGELLREIRDRPDLASVVEALEFGVEWEEASKYLDTRFALLRFDSSPEQHAAGMDFVFDVLADKRGRYGFWTILSILLTLLAESGLLVLFGALAGLWELFTGGGLAGLLLWIFITVLITVSGITFGATGTRICSGLGAEYMVRLGEIFRRSTSHTMPADVAHMYGVRGEFMGGRR